MWLDEYDNSDIHLVEVLTADDYKQKYMKNKYDNGGGVYDTLVHYVTSNLDKGEKEYLGINAFSKEDAEKKAKIMFNQEDADRYDATIEYVSVWERGEAYKNGGFAYVDLFEDYENIPANVQAILNDYELEDNDYNTLNDLQNELAEVGYTFEFGLDAEPFALRPIGVEVNELQGYEDYEKDNFESGGEANFDVYEWDDKMALINLGEIYEYAIKIDKMIDEDTDLEEWVKMKLTRIEQNIADVKHSLEGWEKYSSGGEIAKKQLLHIAKYSKDLIEMISNGSKLMSWQEGKLSVSAQSIDDIYHHLDYKMGNRAVDLENESEDKFVDGGGVDGDDNYSNVFNHLKKIKVYGKQGNSKSISNYLSVYTSPKNIAFFGSDNGFYSCEVNVLLKSNSKKELIKNSVYQGLLDDEFEINDDEYAGGGDVKGWMKEALLNLQLVEDDNSLQISHTNEDSFYVEGDYAEYRVFVSYDNAYDNAIEQVREDLVENPDYFNQDWLFNWIDMDDTIENILEKYYLSYADDIALEDDSRYNNRLIAEMVANGLMTEEEATSEDADDIAEDNVDNLVNLYVEENMQGDKGVEWYVSNFGEDDFRNLIIDNNLIDISGASEDAIDTDGVGHFLSSYDGIEIELDNDVVAYRTN